MAQTATIHLDWGVFCVAEVATDRLRPIMPPGIRPAEPRPGVGLLTVNLVHFRGGGEGIDLPENHELDIGVAVAPDNAGYDAGPQATTAVHVLNIASTAPGYLDHCRACGYRVHPGAGLRFDLAADGLAGQLRDEDGPILAFACHAAAPGYAGFSRIGQDVVHDERGEYRLNYVFSGEAWATLAAGQFTLEAADHPFFRGILPPGTVACVERSILRPGTPAAIAFHGPDPLPPGP